MKTKNTLKLCVFPLSLALLLSCGGGTSSSEPASSNQSSNPSSSQQVSESSAAPSSEESSAPIVSSQESAPASSDEGSKGSKGGESGETSGEGSKASEGESGEGSKAESFEESSEELPPESSEELPPESSEELPPESSEEVSIPDYSSYGEFSITTTDGSYSYDEQANTYTLAVKAVKAEYELTGFFSGSIVIKNVDNLETFKGVKLTLKNAALVSEGATPTIDYQVDSKNVEIKLNKNSNNVVASYGDAVAINSKNNIEFSGKGNVELASYGEEKHTVKAKGNVRIYAEGNIVVANSAHDAFHGKKLYFTSDDDVPVPFAGKLTVNKAVSQAFDFETDAGEGLIEVNGGSVEVSNCESVFKTDVSLTIFEGATVTASNLSAEAVVPGDASSGLTVLNNGTFTVDGNPYVYVPAGI